MQQEVGAFEVREELVPQADALARALDQSRDVGDRELTRTVRRVDGSEDRGECGERIIGDLRPRIRDARQQRRLPGIGEADQRRIGEQLQPQLQHRLLARQARLGEPWHLPRRRGEAFVAAAAQAATCDSYPRPRGGQVGDQLPVLVEDLRPDGHPQLDRLAGRTVLQRPVSGLPPPGLERPLRPEG